MDVHRATTFLARSALFSRLAPETLREMAQEMRTRTFRKGALIFHQGDPSDSFYVLVEGRVKVFVTSEDGDEMVLATLSPPDALGEVALFDGGERSASAEALQAVTAMALSRSTLLAVLRKDPNAAEALLHSAGSLLRRLTGQAADLVFLDLEGRVAKLLITMGGRYGQPASSGIEIDLGVTQSDLARMVGGSRQSVNQILGGLKARGFIDIRGGTVVLSQPEALRHRARII